MALVLISAILLTFAVSCVAAPKIEHLGQPCRAKNILAGRAVTDPSTGREWLVLCNTNETSGMELIFIDFEKGTGKAYPAPAGSGSWALKQVSGDRLIVGTYYDGKFMVFDLKKMEFVKTIEFPGESYIWNLAMGSDGRIYGGSYGHGKLGALDLDSYTVEDCGAPAPPNMYLRYVSSTPDGRILCNFGMEKPLNMIYDPSTKKFETAPKQLQDISMGVTWNGYFLVGDKAYQGKSFEPVDPPYPAPPAGNGKWSVLADMTTEDTLFLRQDNAIYRYVKGEKELKLLADMDLRGGSFVACSKKGQLLGVRGQAYCVVNPGDKKPHFKTMPVESGPRPTMFLETDDRGRLWGGPHFGQTVFYMDLKTKKAVNTDKICDAGGEVYDVACKDGKVYAVSYSGGDITYFDPELPWDQWNDKNPKQLADVGNKGYIRPVAGVRFGPDGKLYSGWIAKYGVYGGAVAITDPKSGETDLIENPLGEQGISGVAVDDKFIYIGSSLEANGLPLKKGESPKFGIMDLANRKIVFSHSFDGAASVSSMGYDAESKRVAMVVNGKLYIFDTAGRRFVDLPADMPVATGARVLSGDSRYCYGSEKSLVAVDMKSGQFTRLVELPEKISQLTVTQEGTFYVSCGADVYSVRTDQ